MLPSGLELLPESSEVRADSSSNHSGEQPSHRPVQRELVRDLCRFAHRFTMQNSRPAGWGLPLYGSPGGSVARAA